MTECDGHDPAGEESAVVVDCTLAEPPEKVWRALTVPALLAEWLMPNDMRPEIGHRFTLAGEPGTGGTIACEVLDVEPHRLLRYSWRGGDSSHGTGDHPPLDTVVTFVLDGTPSGGTRLRIVHSGFAPAVGWPAMMMAGAARLSRPDLGRGGPLAWRTIRGGLDGRPASTRRIVLHAGMRRAA